MSLRTMPKDGQRTRFACNPEWFREECGGHGGIGEDLEHYLCLLEAHARRLPGSQSEHSGHRDAKMCRGPLDRYGVP